MVGSAVGATVGSAVGAVGTVVGSAVGAVGVAVDGAPVGGIVGGHVVVGVTSGNVTVCVTVREPPAATETLTAGCGMPIGSGQRTRLPGRRGSAISQ